MTALPGWITERLRCPCPRHAPLDWSDGPRCTVAGCPNAAGFPIAAGQPALIDFPDSIIDRGRFEQAAGQSPIKRSDRDLRYWVRRLAYGENNVAPRSADRLLRLLAKTPSPVILIVGGGSRGAGTDRLFAAPGTRPIVFDIYASAETHFVADCHGIPMADGSVDAVWIQAVLEHVLEPWRVADEIHRVLKPGGLVYAETPFMQHVHEGAYDFTRFTENGHRWLFRRFDRIASGPVSGPGSVLIWSIRAAVTGLVRSGKIGELLTLPFFWLRWLDLFVGRDHASDSAGGVYFLGRRSDATIEPRDIVSAYRGVRRRGGSGPSL
jgi:SAM-dependent methyltransferase